MEVEVRRFQVELGIPFVYVTHNQEEALTMSDRIAVMREGSFDQVGPKLDLYHRPATPFVAGFVGHSNRMSGRLVSVSGAEARLAWGGVELVVPAPAGAASGANAEYFVKSERIAVARADGRPPEAAVNGLEGTLRDVIFKGQTADYLIALDNGIELVASEASAATPARRGERIVASWRPEAGHCFLASGAAA